MDLSIKSLKNVIKALIVFSALTSPVYAKQAVQHSVLATNYVVQDLDTGEIITEKNSLEIRSIASITKVMTSIVVLDAGQSLDEVIIYHPFKGVSSKLPNGAAITRANLLLITLMSSDNGAAKTLATHYPGGEEAAIAAMNAKARVLNMLDSQFSDPTGLYTDNLSTARDLIKLINYAYSYPIIRDFSTKSSLRVEIPGKKKRYIDFRTTNYLVSNDNHILLSKTGWIRASGGCLIMIVQDQGKRLAVILLNSRNTITRIRDGLLLTGYNNVRNQRNFR